jgi:hypothetical protein
VVGEGFFENCSATSGIETKSAANIQSIALEEASLLGSFLGLMRARSRRRRMLALRRCWCLPRGRLLLWGADPLLVPWGTVAVVILVVVVRVLALVRVGGTGAWGILHFFYFLLQVGDLFGERSDRWCQGVEGIDAEADGRRRSWGCRGRNRCRWGSRASRDCGRIHWWVSFMETLDRDGARAVQTPFTVGYLRVEVSRGINHNVVAKDTLKTGTVGGNDVGESCGEQLRR